MCQSLSSALSLSLSIVVMSIFLLRYIFCVSLWWVNREIDTHSQRYSIHNECSLVRSAFQMTWFISMADIFLEKFWWKKNICYLISWHFRWHFFEALLQLNIIWVRNVSNCVFQLQKTKVNPFIWLWWIILNAERDRLRSWLTYGRRTYVRQTEVHRDKMPQF